MKKKIQKKGTIKINVEIFALHLLLFWMATVKVAPNLNLPSRPFETGALSVIVIRTACTDKITNV